MITITVRITEMTLAMSQICDHSSVVGNRTYPLAWSYRQLRESFGNRRRAS